MLLHPSSKCLLKKIGLFKGFVHMYLRYAGRRLPLVPLLTSVSVQAAWLRHASIKDNILFNLPYNEERYIRTLEVTWRSYSSYMYLTKTVYRCVRW